MLSVRMSLLFHLQYQFFFNDKLIIMFPQLLQCFQGNTVLMF